MRYYIRNALPSDCDALYELSCQANLLNLPPDRKLLEEKLQASFQSFSDMACQKKALFMFILEDSVNKKVIGTSLIIPEYASEDHPLYHFEITKKGNAQVLRLGKDTGGISAIGGLVLNKNYRKTGQKLGKQISLIRMIFMGMFPEKFEQKILSELMPIIESNGVNRFWQELGQKFTGLTYEKALNLARRKEKSFIREYFPEKIVLTHKMRHIHRHENCVLKSGLAEKYILEKVGFRYINRVDPLDGGLQYEANLKDITLVKKGGYCRANPANDKKCDVPVFIGCIKKNGFTGGLSLCAGYGKDVYLPNKTIDLLEIENSDKIYISPMD